MGSHVGQVANLPFYCFLQCIRQVGNLLHYFTATLAFV